MVKAFAIGTIVATAALAAGISIGSATVKSNYEELHSKALYLCDRPGYGTAFVSYRFGTWHCFYRHSEYPYRVKYATIVMNEQ